MVSVNDHPIWGNAFYGLLEGTLKQPQEYSVKLQFLSGKENGVSYWFGELGVSTSGHKKVPADKVKTLKASQMSKSGIKIGPVEITGITGRVYHNMRPNIAVGVDCNMDFDNIAEPGLEAHDFDISLPDLSDFDICNILNNLNTNQIKSLLCSLEKDEFNSVLEKIPSPDFDDIQDWLEEQGTSDSEFINEFFAAHARIYAEGAYNETGVEDMYNEFTYARLAEVFPGYDWCEKVATDMPQGTQWCDLLFQMPSFQWPRFPSICELSGYLLTKVLGEIPDPSYDDLEAIMKDEDWSLIKVEKPNITWPKFTICFPIKTCAVL